MHQVLRLLLTLAVGGAAGLIFLRLKIPGGMMVGAIVGVMALNLSTGMAIMPFQAKFAAQAVAGAFIGCSIEKADILHLPRLIKPLGVMLLCLLATNILAGLAVAAVSPLDPLTALFSGVPGGMSDIPIIASDLGADAGKVAVLQFVRMAAGIGVFPSVIYGVDRRLARRAGAGAAAAGQAAPTRKKTSDRRASSTVITLAAAMAGGLVGRWAGIPAGTLVFSMVFVIVLKLASGRGFLPPWIKRVAQVLSGAYIGCSMSYRDLAEMKYLILPAIIILVCFMINCFGAGWLLRRIFGFERKMAMLAATPAGASDMALISADIGVSSPDLVVLQILRMITVITIFPQVIMLVARLVA